MRTTGQLVLPHELASAAVARRHLTTMLRRQGVSPDRCDDAALLVSELVGNALRHARPRGDGALVVRWQLRAHRLRLEVADGGGSTRPTVRRAPDGVVPTSGRGLAIVDVLSEDWGVQTVDGGTSVWAVISAPPMPKRGDEPAYAALERTG